VGGGGDLLIPSVRWGEVHFATTLKLEEKLFPPCAGEFAFKKEPKETPSGLSFEEAIEGDGGFSRDSIAGFSDTNKEDPPNEEAEKCKAFRAFTPP